METFLALLPYILGTASVASIILFFVFYRQNKTLKNHEVAKSRTEVEGGEIQNDMAQIDLGNHYLKSIIEASEMINEANKSIVSYSKDRKDGFDKLNKDIKEIKEDVTWWGFKICDVLHKITLNIQKFRLYCLLF